MTVDGTPLDEQSKSKLAADQAAGAVSLLIKIGHKVRPCVGLSRPSPAQQLSVFPVHPPFVSEDLSLHANGDMCKLLPSLCMPIARTVFPVGRVNRGVAEPMCCL